MRKQAPMYQCYTCFSCVWFAKSPVICQIQIRAPCGEIISTSWWEKLQGRIAKGHDIGRGGLWPLYVLAQRVTPHFGQSPLAGPYWGWKVKPFVQLGVTVSQMIVITRLFTQQKPIQAFESQSYSETPRISVFRLSEIGGESSNDMDLREGRGLYEVVCAFRSKMIVEVISLLSKFL